MFRKIWPLMRCGKTLTLLTYRGSGSLPPITSTSVTRRLNMSRCIRICTTQSFAKVKVQLDENRNERGNKIGTIPNALCLFRIATAPLVGYLIVKESYLIALALFTVSGITDWLDGYIARNFRDQSSMVGSIIDPVADKIFVTTVFVTLSYVKLVPLVLTIVVILRDVGLIIGGAVTRYKTMAKPKTLARYFNPSVSPLQVTPTYISKANTALQMCAIAGSLSAPVSGFVDHPFLIYIYFATAATTICSGFQYARLTRMKRINKE